MTYKKMVLIVLLLIISGAILRTDGPRARVAQWQTGNGSHGVASICRDEPVFEAVRGRVPGVRVNAREEWSVREARQCAVSGDIEFTLDLFFFNPGVVMFGAVVEAVTGLRLDSALRTLVVGALRLSSLFLPIEILGNPGRSVVL